ncbi:type IV toxin-antitoxin system AbiEi family antitoxin [Methylocystis sp.]|uniref:type IV toxin-antitoxin system AbiEi family antitoxin n=1 Tax=Methylocystis sp. TaxID=1911079 RepID=UPI0025F90B29|nr:type IV toxin-antitoxin system AbiEi family antitoxin [Methylocystis sp.]
MLKAPESVKELENRAAAAFQELVAEVPAIRVERVEIEPALPFRGIDILVHLKIFDRPQILVCEVKSSGQPRNVRESLLQLRNYVAHSGHDAVPVLIAPYLSPEAQALCKEHNVAFLDLVGNARLAFDNLFIERRVADRPPADRRALRSLFKPKSARVLRIMFRDPGRAWRVTELAETAGVSLGHVSNVRTGLLDRELARVSEDGLVLSEPDALLNAWRDEYEAPEGKRLSFYTILHGSAFERAARDVLGVSSGSGKAVFAFFSAAHWLAPFGRTGMQYFYADSAGLELLKERLELAPSPKGENVTVTVPKDLGLFRDTVEPAPGAICTSAVQTYLDLWVSGERGREAAEHLRQEKLSWKN